MDTTEWLEFLKIVIWPFFWLFLALVFREPLVFLIKQLSALKLPGGIEIELTKAVTSAASAAAAVGTQEGVTPQEKQDAIRTIVRTAVDSAKAPLASRSKTILWVDDNPGNNANLASAFHTLGIQITNAVDTETALSLLGRYAYDVIITDMGRGTNGTAGLDLVKAVRAQKLLVPIIIYAAGWARAHRGQESEYDVTKITNDPSEVYQTALTKLGAIA